MIDISMKFDASHIMRLFVELEKQLKVNMKSVLHAEASSVAKQCALWQKTRMSNSQAKKFLREKIWRESFGNIGNVIRVAKNSNSSNGYNRGAVFYRFAGKDGKKRLFYVGQAYSPKTRTPILGFKMPRNMWRDFKDYWQDGVANFKTETARRVPNIGFTRKTWIQVAMSLGYSFDEITKIPPRKSLLINNADTLARGSRKIFGTSYQRERNNEIAITIVNSSRVAVRSDSGNLQRALRSRQRAFEIALDKGVFNSAKEIEKRYGWVKVLR
jgi:hypothetical protein